MTRDLSIADLLLQGTNDPFYLNEGETVEDVIRYPNGSAAVRVRSANGTSSLIDVDVRKADKPREAYEVHSSGGTSTAAFFGFERALERAQSLAAAGRPARVYRIGVPNVLLATVHVDGGIDFTGELTALERCSL